MSRLRAAIKLAGIVGGLVAVPLVLYATTGNPLPSLPIDWGLVAESLTTGAIATGTWLKIVAVGGWLLWTWLVVAVVAEVAATVRGRMSPVRVAPIQWLASTIVALATQLASVSGPAVTTTGPPAVLAVAHDLPVSTADVPHSDAPTGTELVVASEGDSWAGFAASAVGDSDAAATIRRLNHGRDVGGHVVDGAEAFVEAGWRLLVPATDTNAMPSAETTGEPSDATEPDEALETSWTVRRGDHFWAIAKQTLEDAWGRTPTDGETVPYWRELIEHNRDRLVPPHDPNLIFPGQRFVLPPVPTSPDGATARPPRDEHPADREAPQSSADEPTTDASAEPNNGRPTSDREPERPSDASVDDTRDADLDEPAPTQPDDSEHPEIEVVRTAWGIPVALAGATAAAMLLAGGVLAAVRRRRRIALQQRPVQVRLPPLTPEQAAQMARLEAATPPDETLDELADLLASIPEHAAPTLAELDDDGTVRLIFAPGRQLPDPPAPWASAPRLDEAGQVVWVARLGGRGSRRSIGLPLLVTLGRDAQRTVLANGAAMRTLAVTADDPATLRRRLRAVALETATSRTAGPIEVAVVGDTTPAGIEQLQQVDDPVAVLEAAVAEAEQDLLTEDRLPRLIVCHDPSNVPALPDGLDLVAIVAAGTSPSAGQWCLHLDGQRTILHTPDGSQRAFESPDFDPDLIDDQFAALDVAELAPEVVRDRSADPAAVGPIEPGWCEIGLLGPMTVTCGGRPIETLAPIPRQVLAYLATHPGATSEQVENAVWAGRADTSGGQYRVRNALHRLRTELGAAPDGTPLVPRREPSSPMMHLPPAVTTDLDRAFAHLDAARRLDGDDRLAQLLAALDLVRGAPFVDMPVTWTADIEHQAISRLQDAAFEVAEALLEAGRYDDAEHAVQQGLRLCDPCEPLYVLWARIEHARRQLHRIPQLWTRLRQRYAEDTDDTFDTPVAPTADTQRAFAALLSRDTTSV